MRIPTRPLLPTTLAGLTLLFTAACSGGGGGGGSVAPASTAKPAGFWNFERQGNDCNGFDEFAAFPLEVVDLGNDQYELRLGFVGEQFVFAEHAEDPPETRALHDDQQGEDSGEQAVDDQQVLKGADVLFEDQSDAAKSFRAIGPDHLAVDLDLVAEHLEDETHHLGEGERRDREERGDRGGPGRTARSGRLRGGRRHALGAGAA